MRHLKTYENIDDKALAKILLDVLKNNGFEIYGTPFYFNKSWSKVELSLPSSREVGAIAEYYQELLKVLENFDVEIIEHISNIDGRSFEIKFSNKTWEELKIYAETEKYNL